MRELIGSLVVGDDMSIKGENHTAAVNVTIYRSIYLHFFYFQLVVVIAILS